MSFNPLSVSLGPPLLYKHSLQTEPQTPQPTGTAEGGENFDSSGEEENLPPHHLSLAPPSAPPTMPEQPPKPVDNYSGKYSKEEVLALHRLDYPQPFPFEEVITSATPLYPVATYKYRRFLDSTLKDTNNNWEGSFFTLGKSTKGRGRGKRFADDQIAFNSAFTDPRLIRSEPLHQLLNSTTQSTAGGTSTSNPPFLSSTLSSSHSQYPPNSYLYLFGEEVMDDEKWHYKDPKGQERGPFGGIQMDKWVKYDFFKVDLLVRRDYQTDFVHLGDVFFSEQRNPFTGEPLMEWFQGPSSEFKTSLMLLIQNFLLNRLRPELDLSTSTGFPSQPFFPSNPSGSAPSLPRAESTPSVATYPINNPVNQEPPPSADREIPRPKHWWESSDAMPKRSQNPNLEKSTSSSSSTTTATANENDWQNLQEKQTKVLRQVLEDMKIANEEIEKKLQQQNKKKKKGKKKEPQSSTATTTTTTKNLKSKSLKLNNQPQSNNNTQKNTKAETTKPANTKSQINQSTKKPKPQYKLKETTPEPEPALPSQSSPSQQSKRPHKPPKVWKLVEKRDEDVNQLSDQPNTQIYQTGDEEKTTQGQM